MPIAAPPAPRPASPLPVAAAATPRMMSALPRGRRRRERRAIVTENVVDFVELHRSAVVSGMDHYGLVFTSPRGFPRTRRAIGRLVRALDARDEHTAGPEVLDQVPGILLATAQGRQDTELQRAPAQVCEELTFFHATHST